MGAGGVGCYYGAKYLAAGSNVCFVARGEHLSKMQSEGLFVESPLGDMYFKNINATSDPSSFKDPDIVLMCVKNYDLVDAANVVKPIISEKTVVVLIQNGISAFDMVKDILPKQQLSTGFVIIGARIEEPGKIKHTSKNQSIHFSRCGELSDKFADLCRQAGLGVDIEDEISKLQWGKFLRLSPMASTCALKRVTFGEVLENPEYNKILRSLIAETLEVGRALGVVVDKDVNSVMARFPELPYDFKPSMLVDIERGKKMEVEWFCGAIHKLGIELGVSTPVNTSTYEALKPYKDGKDI